MRLVKIKSDFQLFFKVEVNNLIQEGFNTYCYWENGFVRGYTRFNNVKYFDI